MEIRFETRTGYLLVIVTGAFDVQQARWGMVNIVKECEARGLTRILIDGRGISTSVSIADRYDLAAQLADAGKGRLRMAIVVAPENMFTKTFEDTATNRGLGMRTTDSMDEALAFLEV